MTRLLLAIVALAGLAAPLAAQQPAAPSAPGAPAGAPAAPAVPAQDALPVPPANFSYTPEGRRDPFVSLIARGSAMAVEGSAPRVEGLPGLRVEEVVVRGILQSRGGMVAMVAGPNGKTFIVRPGDKLADGTIRAITPQALVIMQVVNDPLSLDKQREVRKPLRVQEEGK